MMSRVKKSSTEYTPYNLRIASFDQIDPNNYMTISESGVINVIAGESTFTPLDRWEQEYKYVGKNGATWFFAIVKKFCRVL